MCTAGCAGRTGARGAPRARRPRRRSRAGAAPGPRPGVRAVVGRRPALAELQGPEGVDHHGELVEVLLAERLLDRSRLRAVAVPARVQGHRAGADAGALAGLVVAAAVEHHLITVDVRVV